MGTKETPWFGSRLRNTAVIVNSSASDIKTFAGIVMCSLKRYSKFWLIIVLATAVAGCSEDSSGPSDPDTHVAAVRPHGEVVGNVENHEVGPEGGTFKSASGMIELVIPSGALAASTTIGIQEIKNTAPNGSGVAYRLTPHNIQFEKPVELTIYYNADSISFQRGLGIAYQGDDGIWYWPGTRAHDLMNRKLTVETNHFSDWTVFESIKLLPSTSVVEPGGKVTLAAYGVLRKEIEEDLLTPLVPVAGPDDDLLTPLVPPEPVGLSESVPLDVKYIQKWILSGEGTLQPSGHQAVYTAPQTIPQQNPAEVTLYLRMQDGSVTQLISRIIVGGSEVNLNGGPYGTLTAHGNVPGAAGFDAKKGVTSAYVYTHVGDLTIGVSISFPGKGVGTTVWFDPDCFVATAQSSTKSDRTIVGTIDKPDDNEVHSGYVKVDRYDEVGGLITGSFEGSLTFLDTQCGACKTVGTIKGKFIARRLH
ncbi:MAG TPA: hypothetical protein VFT90_06815 [Chryseosolibacter sp.]|nr:hypothetical protein [Chryseosolibacter sp.]